MTTPNPTPEKQNPPVAPEKETRQNPANENATGFFNRVQRGLDSKPIHPSEEAEIVVDPDTLEQT